MAMMKRIRRTARAWLPPVVTRLIHVAPLPEPPAVGELVAIGLHLLDNLALGPLAEMAARHDRWAFHLCIAPLRVVGGTGSPVNPIATF